MASKFQARPWQLVSSSVLMRKFITMLILKELLLSIATKQYFRQDRVHIKVTQYLQ